MARRIRIEYAGAVYHVTSRGDRQEPIFVDDADRSKFVDSLAQVCAKTDWQVHAYCLMPNHFHLLIQTPKANLVAGMKWLLGTYTARFNHRHKVTGHLFSGRYKAIVVDDRVDDYVHTAIDYVHLNPTRTKLISADSPLEAYLWSSYPEYLKAPADRPGWLRVDKVFGELGGDSPTARAALSRLTEHKRLNPENPEYDRIRHGWFFGHESFRRELLTQMSPRIGESHYGAERRESSEEKARSIIAEELEALGWTEESLASRRKGDPEKIRIAIRLRKESTMTLKWIADALHAGTWTHLASLISKAPKMPGPRDDRAAQKEASVPTPLFNAAETPAILWD